MRGSPFLCVECNHHQRVLAYTRPTTHKHLCRERSREKIDLVTGEYTYQSAKNIIAKTTNANCGMRVSAFGDS